MPFNILTEEELLTATTGLAFSVRTLKAIGERHGDSSQDQRHAYYEDIEDHQRAVCDYVNQSQGSLKGPAMSARQEAATYVDRAIRQGYKIDQVEIRKELANFLLMLVTEGFKDKDTTGTTVGNFKGDWRGGGFFDYGKT